LAIPKILHQTVRDKHDVHPAFLDNARRLQRLNPDWSYRLYDDADIRVFITEQCGLDDLRYFDLINPSYGAARADFFRYLLLYHVGGVYLDIKATATRPLDEVLQANDVFILSHWGNREGNPYRNWGRHPELDANGELQQWHIVAAPRHPFLNTVIASVKRNIDVYNPATHGVGKMGVMRVTGPIAYTLAIRSVDKYHQYRLAENEELGFQYSIFGTVHNGRAHESYFPNHYTRLSEPVILPRQWRPSDVSNKQAADNLLWDVRYALVWEEKTGRLVTDQTDRW
jgi:inositol phosphorylceramide mannosyltransferase catalytic subunit